MGWVARQRHHREESITLLGVGGAVWGALRGGGGTYVRPDHRADPQAGSPSGHNGC